VPPYYLQMSDFPSWPTASGYVFCWLCREMTSGALGKWLSAYFASCGMEQQHLRCRMSVPPWQLDRNVFLVAGVCYVHVHSATTWQPSHHCQHHLPKHASSSVVSYCQRERQLPLRYSEDLVSKGK
jgi:hypothetical protein